MLQGKRRCPSVKNSPKILLLPRLYIQYTPSTSPTPKRNTKKTAVAAMTETKSFPEHPAAPASIASLASFTVKCLQVLFEPLKDSMQIIISYDPTLFGIVSEGMWDIYQVIQGKYEWAEEECDECKILDFLLSNGGTMFFTGILVLGNTELFHTLIEFIRDYMANDRIERFQRTVYDFSTWIKSQSRSDN